ncbi:hypothetical protein [Leucothrix arctica]|uniref:Lipoprotein n=1 Tax=Leucothrix arctica TaxID=1481894 RepID=A0A317CBH7_9GAMM|nr:hypothetical protein [Leucothrix arctica]PWQ93710.1 hypothetical protein DKT75_19055 [Leucothrix arctica]
MKNTVILALSLLGIVLSGCAVKSDLTESSSFLEIAGDKYRKTGAINTDILFAGVKRSKGFNEDTFDPKFLPVLEQDISARQVTEAFNEQTGKAALEAATKAGIGRIFGGNTTSESKVAGKYSVFTLFNVHKFVSELNSDKNKNNIRLLSRYDSPRIITSVAIVFSRGTTRNASIAGNASLQIDSTGSDTSELTVKAGASGRTSSSLSNGTVFAYQYSSICWEKRDGEIKVATIEVDRPGIGLGQSCPSGTQDRVSNL